MTTDADSPDPETPDEKSVQFINAEVLDPPSQGNVSFVKPLYEQTLVMALEDARSFVQGAEQILLVALAKALEKAISGGATPPESLASLASEQLTNTAEGNTPPSATTAAQPLTAASTSGLRDIESVMASLAKFHATIAETAHKHKGDR